METTNQYNDFNPTFVVNPPSYTFVTLCDDVARNAQTGFVSPTIGVCKRDLDLPLERPSDKSLPRYLVRGSEPRSGRWVQIYVEGEFKIVMYVSSVDEIFRLSTHLCTVCSFPIHICRCSLQSQPAGAVWSLVDEKDRPITTTSQLNSVVSRKKGDIHLILDFAEAVLQSKKTYEEIMSEPGEMEPVLKIVEDAATLFYYVKKSTHIGEVLLAIGTFARSVTGRSNCLFLKDLTIKIKEDLSEYFSMQSNRHWIDALSDIHDNYSKCKNSILVERLKRVFNHVIAHCFYHKMGIAVDDKLFEKFEEKKIRPNLVNCLTFVDAVVSLLVFLLKAGRQCMIAKSIEPMFMNGDSVTDWLMRVKQLKVNSEFLGNPKAIGLSIHTFLSDLDRAIEEGESLTKFLSRNSIEYRSVLGMRMEMDAIKKRYLCVTAASSLRKQPLGVVIYGSPGVGKSSIVEMLFNFDALRRGRSAEPGYKFQYESDEDYMTNFKSSMHTIVIDDAAQHNPGKVQGVDTSVSLILKIINNQGYCPPQAALEDKGKTPMLVDLCLVTTNCRDLNIPIYYPASYAAMRRLKIHLEVRVKDQYRLKGADTIDPEKAIATGPYPDFWTYKVSHAVRVGDKMQGEYVHHKTFNDVKQFLEYFGKVSDDHARQQENFLAEQERYAGGVLCSMCSMPTNLCECVDDVPVVQGMKIAPDGSRYYVPDRRPKQLTTVQSDNSSDEEPTSEATSEEEGDANCSEESSEDVETKQEKKFKREEKPEDDMSIFQDLQVNEKRPWRIIEHIPRAPRRTTIKLGYRFYEKNKTEYNSRMNEVKEYSFVELPMLLEKGWTNSEIYADFTRYMEYAIEKNEIDELTAYSHLITEEVATQLHISDRTWLDAFLRVLVDLYFASTFVRGTTKYFSKYYIVKKTFVDYMRPALVKTSNQKYFAKKVGEKIDNHLGGSLPWVKRFAWLVFGVSALASYYVTWNWVMDRVAPRITYEEEDGVTWECSNGRRVRIVARVNSEPPITHVCPEDDDADTIVDFLENEKQEVQGHALRTVGKMPEKAEGDEKTNVWIGKERTVTTIDFLPQMTKEPRDLDAKLVRNSLLFDLPGKDEGGSFKIEGRLLALSNEAFLTNNHSLPEKGDLKLTVHFGAMTSVSPTVCCLIKQNQVVRVPKRDIAIIKTKSLPALFKNISSNFVHESFDGVYDGYYFIKNKDGSYEKREVCNIRRQHYKSEIAQVAFDMESFIGTVQTPTELGDCGSPLVVLTGHGPIIVGIHSVLHGNKIVSTRFSHEDFKEVASDHMVQCGRIPIVENTLTMNKKSYVDFHDHGRIMYHGELMGFRMRPKHHVFETELASQIFGRKIGGKEIVRRLTGPVMDSWRPQQLALKEFIEPVDFMDETILSDCVEAFVSHVLKNLPESEWKLMHPVSIDVAVNGVPGMAYMDPLKRSTSMGYPWKTTKRKFLEPLDDDFWPEGMKFTDEIEEEIARWFSLMRKGIRCHPVFSANLKDEPVSFKKKLMAKTRVFFSGPLPYLVVLRMMFMGFCRVVQRNPYVFHSAVGMNCHSLEWEKLFRYLSKFGVNRTIAGDYAFFDKKVKMLLMRFAMEFVIRICKRSGNYSDFEILVMEVLMLDLMNPSVDYFGMLITLLGGEVSGHQLTTILNIIINILYLMYVYALCGYCVFTFFVHVVVIALGDDHILSVSDKVPEYTHTRIQKEMKYLGIDYTMADKTSESRPYISLYEGSFLKRSFRYDIELGVHVAPLEVESIFKMLTVQVESKACSKSEQLAQAMTSATMEAFFHGRAFYDEIVDLIDTCEKSFSLKCQMEEYEIKTWEENVRRFWSTDDRHTALSLGRNQKEYTSDSYCPLPNGVLQGSGRMGVECEFAWAFPEVRIYGEEQTFKEDTTVHEIELSLVPDNKQLAKTNEQTNMSSLTSPDEGGSKSEYQQQTAFVNESIEQTMDMSTGHDVTADDKIISAQLGTFLNRPTKIATYTWTENDAPGVKLQFYPWRLYFDQASIKMKLTNYAFLRCNLKIKFTINASQFYYGSMAACYQPLRDAMGRFIGVDAAGQQTSYSQQPHVWLDPQSVSTAEMKLPFLYPYNFLDTYNASTFEEMGSVDLVQFAALRSANGVTTTGVTIVIYAWAEDVEITGATSRPVLQAKKAYGPISGPASTVVAISSRLKDAPVVGPFAKATEVVASAIGSVAHFFGFTNVPNVSDVSPMKSVAFHTLASAHISEPINKLSLQPKQEVCIDSEMVGDVYADQLHIANFCQRESFLAGALWSTSDGTDKILFTAGVTPELYNKTSVTPNYEVYGTPMSHAMHMFTYWRGDIIFRFKIIKSQYHRGRLNLCWDVGVRDVTLMPGYGNPAVMNIVFDLEEQDELEVRVPYMQAEPFLMKQNLTGVANNFWSNGGAPGFTHYGNGTVQLRVINRLTAPEASSDVDVLVFVRAAENIEFAAPSAIVPNLTVGQLQANKTYDNTEVFDSPSVSHPKIYDEIFGEKIVSFRELLHRASLASTNIIYRNLTWTSEQMTYTLPIKRIPREYGYNLSGWESAATSVGVGDVPFNFVRQHPINWLVDCFVGFKGSVNYTFNVIFNDQRASRAVPHVSITRQEFGKQIVPVTMVTGTSVSSSQYMRELNTSTTTLAQGATGTALTNQFTQSGVAVNLPYYSNARFMIHNQPEYYSSSETLSGTEDDWFALNLKRGIVAGTVDNTVTIDTYCGTGPDFNLIFFLNVPVLTFLAPPVAKVTG
nr:MAG: hypothetical protein [Marnaviridae sp.]